MMINRRTLLGSIALLPIAGCSDQPMQTETDPDSNTREDDNEFPPSAYRPEQVPDMLQRNEYNNWVASAHLEVQTKLLREQNQLLRDLLEELDANSDK